MREYPLLDTYQSCKNARYVSGTSNYLCECKNPHNCEGWKLTLEKHGDVSYPVYGRMTTRRGLRKKRIRQHRHDLSVDYQRLVDEILKI